MTHPIHTKATALTMLMTGDAVTYVAKTTGVPKQTISRWKPEADALLREIVRSSPALQEAAAQIRAVLPGLSRTKTGLKKGARIGKSRCGNV